MASSLFAPEQTVRPCTVCFNGEPVPFPEKSISIPGFEFIQTCELLETTLPLIVTNMSSPTCGIIQSLGSICGCEIKLGDDVTSCQLCEESKRSNFMPSKPIPPLKHLFEGFVPTCELLEAYLLTKDEHDVICDVASSFLRDYCGCGETEMRDDQSSESLLSSCSLCLNGGPIEYPEKRIGIDNFPFETCHQLEEATNLLVHNESDQCEILQKIGPHCGCPVEPGGCQVCPDGGPMAFPEKKAKFLAGSFGGIIPTCELIQSFMKSMPSDSSTCQLIREGSGFCGCAPISEDHCLVCLNETPPVEYSDREIPPMLLSQIGFDNLPFPITCELGLAFQYQTPAESKRCDRAIARRDICGCNNGEYKYFAGDTKRKRAILAWTPRVVAIFSFIGGLTVIRDVICDDKRRKNLYNQIMLCMSCFDLVSAIAWSLSTLPNPTDDIFPTYGERGNELTCKLQGWMFQFGMTSIFFNLSLCLYYTLVIAFQWRGRRLHRIKPFMIAAPLILGVGIAFAGLPYYSTVLYGCHFAAPPLVESWLPGIILFLVPIFSVIVVVTLSMMFVYYRVRKQARSSRKWRFSFRERQLKHPGADASSTKTSPSPSLSLKNVGSSEKSGATTVVENAVEQTTSFQRNQDVSQNNDKKQKKAKKSNASKLEHEVLWQSIFYVSAFYVSWPMIAYTYYDVEGHPMRYWMVLFIISPMQGFLNAGIYFRPRLKRMATLRARKRQSSGGDNTLPNVTSSHDIFNNLLQKSFLRIICFRERRSEQPRPPVVNNEDVDEDIDESFEPSAAIAEDYGPSDKMESDDKYVNPDDVDRGNPTTLLPIREENASV